MTPNISRSEEVVKDYKKRKLARSAYMKIRDTIDEWDNSRKVDHKLAVIGVCVMLLIIVTAIVYFRGSQSIIIG